VLPSNAAGFCWAYPTTLPCLDEWALSESYDDWNKVEYYCQEPAVSFLLFGGFVYFDKDGAVLKCVGVQKPGSLVDEHFCFLKQKLNRSDEATFRLSKELWSFLQPRRKEFCAVQMKEFVDVGIEWYLFLPPGAVRACEYGGFIFVKSKGDLKAGFMLMLRPFGSQKLSGHIEKVGEAHLHSRTVTFTRSDNHILAFPGRYVLLASRVGGTPGEWLLRLADPAPTGVRGPAGGAALRDTQVQSISAVRAAARTSADDPASAQRWQYRRQYRWTVLPTAIRRE
jgi:hypothetical protein